MEKLITVQELAKILHVPVSWIYDRTRKAGPETLPHYKIGKYIRFWEIEVLEYLKQQKIAKVPVDN
jgi:excisionase family DNA binding protein